MRKREKTPKKSIIFQNIGVWNKIAYNAYFSDELKMPREIDEICHY